MLDFPEIQAPAALQPAPAPAPAPAPTPVATVPATLKQTVLAQFQATEASLLLLAAKYRDVAFDCSTPKGLATAKAARLDLRENGRYLVERAEKRIKADVNELKAVVSDEVARLVSMVRPVEDNVHEQIQAREAEIAREKAERERIEAERVAKLQAGIDAIRSYVERAAGLPSERIAKGIAQLEALTFPVEAWAEFAVPAANAQCETLERLRGLHAQAMQAEADKAEAERLRAEHAAQAAELAALRKAEAERKAAEDAARAAELAEAKRQEAALEAARDAAEDAATETTEAPTEQQVLKAEPATADATDREDQATTSPRGGAMGEGQPAAAGPAKAVKASRKVASPTDDDIAAELAATVSTALAQYTPGQASAVLRALIKRLEVWL